MIKKCIIIWLFIIALSGPLFSAIPQIEREALIALYNSTNGDNWTSKTGWKTPPLHTDGFALPGTECYWKGVIVTNECVKKIWLYSHQLNGHIPPEIGNLTIFLNLFIPTN
jgi:hypothetical protein